jgi:hypothetical protein
MPRRAPIVPLVLSMFAPGVHAGDIYATNFNNYATGTLSGQLAWIGTGGTWAVSGVVNAPQLPANVLGPGVAGGVNPYGGKGRMVRLCTERFNAGRTKAWLDLANSGRWAAASGTARRVLETRVKINVPAGQSLPAAFGIMISRDPIVISGGFVVSAQDGAISLLDGGPAAGNRIATGVSAPLNAWNDFTYRWNVDTGEGTLLMNGVEIGNQVTAATGSVYASNLVAATDAAPGLLNAFGCFDDFGLAAVASTVACPGDFDGNGTRDAADLAAILGAWGTPAGDLDGDADTDAADLSVLLGGWGPCR